MYSFSNLFIFEWGFDATYPPKGKIWTFPIALSKIYGITALAVYNVISTENDGATRVRTYDTAQATFSNGFTGRTAPLFYSVIGQT